MSICRPIYRSRGAQNTHDPKKIQLQLFSYCKYSSRIIIILRQKTHIHANPAYGVYISQLGRYARICTSKVDFMNRLLGLPLRLRQQAFETNLLQKSFNKFFNRAWSYRREVWCNPAGDEISNQAWIAPSYSYITYLLLRLFFQLYLGTCARAILLCARALFINLIDVCI